MIRTVLIRDRKEMIVGGSKVGWLLNIWYMLQKIKKLRKKMIM